MKFSSITTAVLISILAFGSAVQSGIDGSDHDLAGFGKKLCDVCHSPHNASGDALWSSAPSGIFSGVADLCYSCHDGSLTTVGITTAFDQSKDQHMMVGSDCSADDGCHDVHNQNPNGTGRFLAAGVTRTNNSFCETCHDDTPFSGADRLDMHNTANSHYTNGSTFICESCHSAHGAVMQTVNPIGLTHPILLANDNVGNSYGEFCISCHNGIAPTEAVPGTGGVASIDAFDYYEDVSDGNQSKHTTDLTAGEFLINGCGTCHVDMCADMPALNKYDLRADNTNSSYCVLCHTSGEAPSYGENSHFSQGVPADITMNVGSSPILPWSNEIDEDGSPGQDWLSATANMLTCQTCHSVHRKGFTGADAGFLLRYPNDAESTICATCHGQN